MPSDYNPITASGGGTSTSQSSGITGIKASTPAVPTSTAASDPKFVFTDGWYVAIACISGVAVANTRIGPIAFGILSLALLYQTSLLLQGK